MAKSNTGTLMSIELRIGPNYQGNFTGIYSESEFMVDYWHMVHHWSNGAELTFVGTRNPVINILVNGVHVAGFMSYCTTAKKNPSRVEHTGPDNAKLVFIYKCVSKRWPRMPVESSEIVME